MDFKQLETFVMVAKLKSFSKAADKLFLTQPTVSNHIQNLEKELKSILINRQSKYITLTNAGDILLKYAVDILNKRDNALFSLSEIKGKIEGSLEISASTIPEEYYLPRVIKEFQKKYPLVSYNLKKLSSKEVLDHILNGDVDFGIVGFRQKNIYLDYKSIMEDEIVLVSLKDSNYSSIIDESKLTKLPLIMRQKGSGTREIVESYLDEKNLDVDNLNVIAFVENNQTIKKMVALGLGATFISKRAVEKELKNGVFKEIRVFDYKMMRNFYFVYHKNRILSPLAEEFKKFIL
ncbi:selenium metabolism-associated LysR family transcriptional regulator [Peptostreptococcaceae bacterium AGR-M142]